MGGETRRRTGLGEPIILDKGSFNGYIGNHTEGNQSAQQKRELRGIRSRSRNSRANSHQNVKDKNKTQKTITPKKEGGDPKFGRKAKKKKKAIKPLQKTNQHLNER